MKQKGVVLDVFTYSALINACGNGKRPEQALELFETMQQQGVLPDVSTYNSLMQVLASAGQIVAGFGLLAQAEAFGLLSHSDENWYPMFRMLLEACRTVGNSESARQLQEARKRLGYFAIIPVATALV